MAVILHDKINVEARERLTCKPLGSSSLVFLQMKQMLIFLSHRFFETSLSNDAKALLALCVL